MGRDKCLTLDQRIIIQTGISNNSSKTAIALTIGKDPSTVGKEIKLHRYISYKSSLVRECANYKHCKNIKHCSSNCTNFIPFKCNRRDRSPGACNGCSTNSYCRFTKYKYDAKSADNAYRRVLVESREGFNLTKEELDKISEIVCPLLLNGQSPYVIINNHPELNITEKTLYTYIEADLFKKHGVSVMDLRRYVGRKMTKKKKNEYKKRNDYKYLINRTYDDFNNYIEQNPNTLVVEMDTVFNDAANGPFMQTFKIVDFGFLFALYHEEKTEESMTKGINTLNEILGDEIFGKYFSVILSDRGSEFKCPVNFETNANGEKRCIVFYCDPMMSCQKGSLENNHEELRYFFPKGKDLRLLGLTSQKNLNLVISHINSTVKEKLKGKSPIELIKFYAPELLAKLQEYGIQEIPKDEVVLNTSLLKNYK